MLIPNYTAKAGNFYTFPAIATASTKGACIFDRPVKNVRIHNTGLSLCNADGDVLCESGIVNMFPSIYGYPKQLFVLSGDNVTNEAPVIEVLEYGDHASETYFNNIEPLVYALRAKGGTATMFGKKVNLLQSEVAFDNVKGTVSGTLLYVSDYTGFSGDQKLQKGNYLAWAVDTSETGVTYKAWLEGSSSAYDEAHAVTLDSDKDAVFRIQNTNEVIVIKAEKSGRETVTKRFALTGLTLTPAEG